MRNRRISAALLPVVMSGFVIGCSNAVFEEVGAKVDEGRGVIESPPAVQGTAVEECPSHALRVDLNQRDASSKDDLVSLWKVLSRYPQTRFLALESARQQVALRVQTNSLNESLRLQIELLRLGDVEISCDSAVEPSTEEDSPQDKQEMCIPEEKK